jgi:hypothetical protein
MVHRKEKEGKVTPTLVLNQTTAYQTGSKKL